MSSCLRTACGEAPLCNANIWEIEAGGQPGLLETLSQKKEKVAQVEIVPNGKGSFSFQQVEDRGWGVQICSWRHEPWPARIGHLVGSSFQGWSGVGQA